MKSVFWSVIIFLSATMVMADEQIQTLAPKPIKEHSFGIRIDPLWSLIGGLGGEVDVRISQSVSIGLGGFYIFPQSSKSFDNTSFSDYKWSSYEIYVGPTIMLLGDYDHHGLYIAPGIGYTGAKITDFSDLKYSGSMAAPELRFTVGYQWIVKNFRFTTGAGLRALSTSDVTVKDSSGNTVLIEKSSTLNALALDLGVGMVF